MTGRGRRIVRTAVRRLPPLEQARRRLRPTSKPPPQPPRPKLVNAAEQAGWRLKPPGRAYLRDLNTELRSREQPTVAILTRPEGRRLDQVVAAAFPDAQVTWVDAGQDPSATHVALAALGPYDVLVDDSTRATDYVRRFRHIFGHVRAGGVLVLRTPHDRPADGDGSPSDQGLGGYLTDLLERQRSEPADAKDPDLPLARSLGRVSLRQRHVVVGSMTDSLAKMREHEMDQVVSLRSGQNARLVENRPSKEFRSRCALRETPGHHNPRMRESYIAPPVSLREYDDVVCASGQVAVQGNLLLPDTYRHNQQRNLVNKFTEDVTARFGRVKADIAEPRRLSGTYLYLDNELRGHFGHTMTEQMSKLWAWPSVKDAYPDVRCLVSFRPKVGTVSRAEVNIFGAAGIEEDRIEVIDEPVLVEKLVAPTPMFSMPAYVHPDIEETWRKVGRTFAAQAPHRDYPRRIFCSRRIAKRSCRNADEVEQVFVGHGFEVVHPEDFSQPEQVKIFQEADVVAGFAGSALFTLCFCESPKRVVMISSESYNATNEYLIASVLGHEIDLIWCPPDSHDEFQSPFSFDFERDGERLREVLAST